MRLSPDDNSEALEISGLYPDLSPDEQAESLFRLCRYVDLICRIHERTKNLTALDQDATI